MGDIGRSGGIGLIRQHFNYNVDNEERTIATVVQSFGSHSVNEGDTISDSDCVEASSYSNFGIVFVKIHNDYDNNERGVCYDLIKRGYVDIDYDFLNYNFNCPNITLLSEKIYNDFLNSKVGNVGINFLAYLIVGVLQAESKKESFNDIKLDYWLVADKLENKNYININIYYGDDFSFSYDINLIDKEYQIKNDHDVEIIIKINKERGVIIEIKNKGIVIDIPLKEIENASRKLANKLDEIHSEPWCE